MRIGNIEHRAVIVLERAGGPVAVDVHKASGGRFGPDPRGVYDDWAAFAAWVAETPEAQLAQTATPVALEELGAPSPEPRQILAIGLNYHDHAAESGFEAPQDLPPVFTKFVSSLSGPVTEVVLPPGGDTDWEVELVVVIGRQASQVDEANAWDHVAGLTVGNDLSERVVQLRGPAPQFGLGKSFPGFAPTGPWLVTPDEVADRDDLEIRSLLDGEVVQHGRTSQLIVPVARLIAELSAVVTLYPGDLIFTGTPAGVGLGRSPQRYIQPGEVLESSIEGIGVLRQSFVAAPAPTKGES